MSASSKVFMECNAKKHKGVCAREWNHQSGTFLTLTFNTSGFLSPYTESVPISHSVLRSILV